MGVDETIAAILEAHGGRALWEDTATLEAELSASGFLFRAKRRPVLNHVRITSWCHEPRFAFHDFPAPGLTGELRVNDEVRITNSTGEFIARRTAPRTCFKGLGHFFAWDDLDFIYFGGYATWNYLTTPFLFLRPGFEFELLAPVEGAQGRLARLAATFPADIPTHSRRQVFYFDEQGLLVRLDYTAEVVGGWARAAHFCEDYRDFGGLKAATKRRVWPTFFGSAPLPFPNLVALDIDEIRPVSL